MSVDVELPETFPTVKDEQLHEKYFLGEELFEDKRDIPYSRRYKQTGDEPWVDLD